MSFSGRRRQNIEAMARAGCNCISFGLQSRTPDILKNIHRKETEPRELVEALKICKESDILTIVTFIFGLPGETEETIESDLNWALEHRPHLADFHPLYILPFTEMAQITLQGPITKLTEQNIERACARSFRKFYLRPSVIFRLLSFIFRRNPRFFLRIGFPMKRLVMSLFESSRPQHAGERVPS